MLPRNIDEWFAYAKRIPRDDEDCVILFTGVERSGKSNTAQIMLYTLDESFGVHRIAFNVPSFFDIVADMPKGRAALLDEAKVNNRKAMHRDTVKLNDWLQVCGGLNHYLGLCYPRAHRIDTLILERMRFNVHMVARGRAVMRTYTGNDDAPWRELFRFDVGRLPDEYRETYVRAKDEAAREAIRRERVESDDGVDRLSLTDELRRLHSDPDARRPKTRL